MNWTLILKLSLFGFAMAIGTVFFIPSNIEPVFWLSIFLVCAYLIAKRAPGRFFLHGFMTSLMNCVWITGAHMLLAEAYLSRHSEEAAMLAKMPLPGHPRIMMLLVGPAFGIAFGIILGLFAFVAGKILKR